MKIKARVLKDAQVKFVSLVDNASSQIPIRVIKRDSTAPVPDPEELSMLHLSGQRNVHKSAKSELAIVICRKSALAATLGTLEALDLRTDSVTEEGGLCMIAQMDRPPSDLTPIQIDKDMGVMVTNVQKGFNGYTSSTLFAEQLGSSGFFPSLNMAMEAMYTTAYEIMYKSDSVPEAAEAMATAGKDFADYVASLVRELPEVVFKLAEGSNTNMANVVKIAASMPYAAKKKKKKTTGKTTTGGVPVAKIVDNDPRPITDPAKGTVDLNLTQAQQQAGEEAAAAVDWNAKDAAYNAAAAATSPGTVGEGDEAHTAPKGDARDDHGETDHDPKTHDGQSALTAAPNPYVQTELEEKPQPEPDGNLLATADRVATEQSELNDDQKVNAGGEREEQVTDEERAAIEQAEFDKLSDEEKLSAGAAPDAVVTDEDGNPLTAEEAAAANAEVTKSAGFNLAMLQQAITASLSPLDQKITAMGEKLTEVETVAKAAKRSSDALGGTVMSTADSEDEDGLVLDNGVRLRKSASVWDGSPLDRIVPH